MSLTASHGIIQNPKKIKFGRLEVEFLGYEIKRDGMSPSNDTIEAIRKFPRPSNITGVRSFFGLVEQVGYAI